MTLCLVPAAAVAEQRFWPRVDVGTVDECWPWTGARTTGGYGNFGGGSNGPRKWGAYAHRTAYLLLVDEIPPGLVVDHLCRNRACCNPFHMEIVTPEENGRRACPRAEFCKRGHVMAHGYLRKSGRYQCRHCANELQNRRRWARLGLI